MKKLRTLEIIVSAIAVIVIVALTVTLGVLKLSNVIKTETNVFLLMFTTLTLGLGLYLSVFAIVRKGGYELAVGLILTIIGVALLLVTLKVDWLITVIVTVGLVVIALFVMILSKAKPLAIERADEKEDFVPYMEQLQAQKQQEKETEEELPKIKSFKD